MILASHELQNENGVASLHYCKCTHNASL